MDKRKYYFIGIGGIGMSGLALIALEKGAHVLGSDVVHSYLTNTLKERGAEVFIGHQKKQVPLDSIVVYSSAIPLNNPELIFAKSHNLTVLHRSELLAIFMQQQKALLIAGTHGKTTTSTLLTHVLVQRGMQPGFALGGSSLSLASHASCGRGHYFVGEADESDGSFLQYKPFGAIITNIDCDHLDYWQTIDKLVIGFRQFIDKVDSSEHFFWHGDSLRLSEIANTGYNYGFDKKNALFIESYRQEQWKNICTICFEGKRFKEIEASIIGQHNILNMAAVFGLCLKLGIEEEEIRAAFISFKGINRRLEYKGWVNGVTFYDDYAHHPAEILTTLAAIKQAVGGKRVVLAFQPHRYSRTLACLKEFGKAVSLADVVVMTDIYAAGEKPTIEISEKRLLSEMKKRAYCPIYYVPRDQLSCELPKLLQKDDCLVTMGAGDIFQVSCDIMENFR